MVSLHTFAAKLNESLPYNKTYDTNILKANANTNLNAAAMKHPCIPGCFDILYTSFNKNDQKMESYFLIVSDKRLYRIKAICIADSKIR